MHQYLKIRFVVILSLVLAFMNHASGQLDSLKNNLAEATTWKEEINAHQDLAEHYASSDSSLVMKHIDAMMSIATAQNDNKGLYQAHTSLASFYTGTSQYGKAKDALAQVYMLSLKMNDREASSATLGNIGVLKYYLNELDSARYYLDTSYRIKTMLPEVDSSNLCRNLNSLAVISRELNLFEDAIVYQTEALKIAQGMGNNTTQLRALSGMAGLYSALDEPEKSFQYDYMVYTKALEIDDIEAVGVSAKNLGLKYFEDNQLDSAFYFYEVSLENFEKIGYKRGLAEAHIAIADAYAEQGNVGKSQFGYQQALRYAKDIKDDKLIANANKNLGNAYVKQGRYREAKPLLHQSLELYQQLNNTNGISQSYDALAELYEQSKDWQQAFVYQGLYNSISDSLDNETYNETVKSLQLKYETELKDSEIYKQKVQIQRQDASSQKLMLSLALVSLLGFATFLILQQRIKKNKIISSQKMDLKNQKISQLESEKIILSMNAMIEGQEVERTRIANDLHDGLGGLLSTVKAHFSNIQKEIKQIESLKVYNRAQEMMDQACDEVRRISHNLMPGALRLEGLKTAVEHLAEEMSEAHPFDINVEIVNFNNRMEQSKEVFVYRIIQEALNNIVKHAEAKNVLVQMSEAKDEYHFIIEDDGKGFDQLNIPYGLGLKSIASRVSFFKGDFDLDTREGVGTTITFHIPKEIDS